MSENKKPQFESIEELADFFDNNDMSSYFDEMPEVHFDMDIQRHSFLVPIDKRLMKKLTDLAKSQHTSTSELVNPWLEEKVAHAA